MKPPLFDYLRPDNLEEAMSVLADHGEAARILAGGQSLMAMLNMRLVQPSLLVDIGRLKSLERIEVEHGYLVVGAGITQAALEWRPALAREVPLLARALPWVGHFQTRNRGTVCGSIAHADPSAELPLCLAALRGDVVLRNARGRRTVAADHFFLGMLTTGRRPDELVESVRFPLRRDGESFAFREMGLRHGDFAICAIAAVARGDAIHLAVGGVADRPVARDLGALAGDAIDDALNDLAWELEGYSDAHATAAYRRALVRTLGREAIEEARTCRS